MSEDFGLLESRFKSSQEFKDLVKVSEVQDALKQLTESFQKKLQDKETAIVSVIKKSSSGD